MSFTRRILLAIIIVLPVAIGAVLLVPDHDGRVDADSFEALASADTEEQLARGEYLAIAGNCATCHTAEDGAPMAGGLPFETPFGRVYSTNITPDADTGIGNWSAAEFADSMRRGVRPDGEHLYPVFPYNYFTRLSDDDLAALYVYLKSVAPVRQENPANALRFPFNLRVLLGAWKKLYLDAGPYEPDPAASAEWNRGAYLVEAAAHCGACHTPRNLLGGEKRYLAMTGGRYFDKVPGGAYRTWFAPNLTAADTGLGIWPEEELVAYLKTGINELVETFGPMNEVIVNSTMHLRDEDVAAMATYLKSLPANEPGEARPAEDRVLGMGRTMYNLHCGTCHLPTGLGDEEMAPRLAAGSLVVRARDPASLINVILYGPELPDPPLPTGRLKPMEEFQYLLDDDEIAALASFVRHSWDNGAGRVTAEQVAEQR